MSLFYDWHLQECLLGQVVLYYFIALHFLFLVFNFRFGLVAFQEVAKKESLQKICDELNNPTLPSVSKWRGARGQWEIQVSQSPTGRMFQGVEYNGFLYDTEQNVALLSASLVEKSSSEDSERAFVRKPYVGHFKVSLARDHIKDGLPRTRSNKRAGYSVCCRVQTCSHCRWQALVLLKLVVVFFSVEFNLSHQHTHTHSPVCVCACVCILLISVFGDTEKWNHR